MARQWVRGVAIGLCVLAVGLRVTRSDDAPPLYLAFEPALAIFIGLSPEAIPPKPDAPRPNLGRVRFGAGDVCCPGIPARNTINIASGDLMTHD